MNETITASPETLRAPCLLCLRLGYPGVACQ